MKKTLSSVLFLTMTFQPYAFAKLPTDPKSEEIIGDAAVAVSVNMVEFKENLRNLDNVLKGIEESVKSDPGAIANYAKLGLSLTAVALSVPVSFSLVRRDDFGIGRAILLAASSVVSLVAQVPSSLADIQKFSAIDTTDTRGKLDILKKQLGALNASKDAESVKELSKNTNELEKALDAFQYAKGGSEVKQLVVAAMRVGSAALNFYLLKTGESNRFWAAAMATLIINALDAYDQSAGNRANDLLTSVVNTRKVIADTLK